MTSIELPSKFSQYCRSSPELDAAFRRKQVIKSETTVQILGACSYISTIPYIFHDQISHLFFKDVRPFFRRIEPLSHLYRIRKAEKIKRYIKQHGFLPDVTVPNKYIYQDPKTKQYYVVAEGQKLSLEIAAPASPAIYFAFLEGISTNTQVESLRQGLEQRELTSRQAQCLAELAFQTHYTDLSYNNLFFTTDGKVAILDTEPVKRALLKKQKQYPILVAFFDSLSNIKIKQALIGTAKLKLYCANKEALQAVMQVEKKQITLFYIKTALKLALLAAVLFYIAPLIATLLMETLSLSPWVFTIVKYPTYFLAVLKVISLFFQMRSLYVFWNLNHKGLDGVRTLASYELQEKI